jgi:hypothetical protein
MEKSEAMIRYEKIYEDTEKIMGKPLYYMGALIGRTERTTEEKLKDLEQYAQKFINEEDRGSLRTILVILKPFKNHEIIKDTAEKLATKLRAGSKNGFI